MMGATVHEYAGRNGIYTVSYDPSKLRVTGFNLYDLTRHFNPTDTPFITVGELDQFIGYADFFSKAWGTSLANQLPPYLVIQNYEPYTDSEESEAAFSLPTGATPLNHGSIGPVAASQPYRSDIYTVTTRGGLVCVRRLSASLFDPPDDEIQGWLSSLAASPHFRHALPSNFKVLN